MKKIYIRLTIAFLIFNGVLRSQNIQKCGTITPLNPEYEQSFQEKIKAYLNQPHMGANQAGKFAGLPTKDIPIIFHIIHDGTPATNISADRVIEQLKTLNDDFAGAGFSLSNTSIYWTNAISNTGIKFCLTTKDKNGNQIPTPTTPGMPIVPLSYGINRVLVTTIPGLPALPPGGYSQADVNTFIKPNVFWDPNNYLNMYVVPLSGGLLGYAVFPDVPGLAGITGGNTTASADGVVCGTTTVGNSGAAGGVYNKGRTMTHEVGHWIGLRHTWGDANCGDDFCADVPPTEQNTFGCPAFPQLYATCATVIPGAQTPNFMDYTDDSCMYLFTHDQAIRMHTALQFGTFRKNLGNANYCSFTPTGSPLQSAAFPTNGCPNYTTQLFGWAPYTADSVWWETPSATPTRTSGGSANVIYAATGTFTATFKAKYPGSPAISKSITITVSAANCTTQTPFAFFSVAQNDTCLGSKIKFKNNSASSSNFKWTFPGGNPATSTLKNPLVTYSALGKYEVILESFTGPAGTGLTSVYKDTVEIKNCIPVAKIDSASQLGVKTFCNYQTITFKDASIATDSVSWLFKDGYPDNSTLQKPSVSYAKPGQYKVKLIASNAIGVDTTEITINIVKCSSSCGLEDTISNYKSIAKVSVLKNTSGWGYIAGHNSDKDVALAERYVNYPTSVKEIRGAIIYFARKYDGTQNSDYKVRIRQADPFGYPKVDSAGGVIAQTNISMQEISTGPGYKGIEVVFNPKAYISNETFFVTLENLNYPSPTAPFGSQDTIAVYSTVDNPNVSGTAFKRWSSDGQWHAINEAISDNKNISLAMYPIVCGPVGLDEIYNKTDNIVVYPNPADNILYLGFNSNKVLKYAYKIFDNSGKIVKYENEFRTKGTVPVDLSDLSKGFYYMQISNNGKLEYHRFTKQ